MSFFAPIKLAVLSPHLLLPCPISLAVFTSFLLSPHVSWAPPVTYSL